MKYSVEIIPIVYKKLKLILQRIVFSTSSLEIGEKWRKKFEKAFFSLEEFPFRYPLIKSRPWQTKGVRKMPIRPYIAYYCVSEEEKRVSVNALSHAKQDEIEVLRDALGF